MDGQPTFHEGKTAIVCRKLYRGQFQPQDFLVPSIADEIYPQKDFHYVYIGEITAIYENR